MSATISLFLPLFLPSFSDLSFPQLAPLLQQLTLFASIPSLPSHSLLRSTSHIGQSGLAEREEEEEEEMEKVIAAQPTGKVAALNQRAKFLLYDECFDETDAQFEETRQEGF